MDNTIIIPFISVNAGENCLSIKPGFSLLPKSSLLLEIKAVKALPAKRTFGLFSRRSNVFAGADFNISITFEYWAGSIFFTAFRGSELRANKRTSSFGSAIANSVVSGPSVEIFAPQTGYLASSFKKPIPSLLMRSSISFFGVFFYICNYVGL